MQSPTLAPTLVRSLKQHALLTQVYCKLKRRLKITRYQIYIDGIRFCLLRFVLRLPMMLGYRNYRLERYVQNLGEKNLDQRMGFHSSGIHMPNDIHEEYQGKTIEYEPSPIAHVCTLLSDLDIPYSRFSFVDIGSGEGRLLCAVSGFQFRQVVGIELSPSLHKVAMLNIQTYTQTRPHAAPITLRCEDATQCTLPDTHLVLYLFNPFSEALLKRLLENVQAAAKASPEKQILIVYYNPVHRAVFENAADLQTVEMPGWQSHVWSVWRVRYA